MRKKPKLHYIPAPTLKPYPTRGMIAGLRVGSEVAGLWAAALALYSSWAHVLDPTGPAPHLVMSAVWFFYLSLFIYVSYSAGAFAGALIGAGVDKVKGNWD